MLAPDCLEHKFIGSRQSNPHSRGKPRILLMGGGHLPFSEVTRPVVWFSRQWCQARLRKEMAFSGSRWTSTATCVWLAEGVQILTFISHFSQAELCSAGLRKAIILGGFCIPGLVARGNLSTLLQIRSSEQMASKRANPEAIFRPLYPHSKALFSWPAPQKNQGVYRCCASKEDRHFLFPKTSKWNPSAEKWRMFFSLTLSFHPDQVLINPGTQLVNSLYADLPKHAVHVPSTLPEVANWGFTTSPEVGAHGRRFPDGPWASQLWHMHTFSWVFNQTLT